MCSASVQPCPIYQEVLLGDSAYVGPYQLVLGLWGFLHLDFLSKHLEESRKKKRDTKRPSLLFLLLLERAQRLAVVIERPCGLWEALCTSEWTFNITHKIYTYEYIWASKLLQQIKHFFDICEFMISVLCQFDILSGLLAALQVSEILEVFFYMSKLNSTSFTVVEMSSF